MRTPRVTPAELARVVPRPEHEQAEDRLVPHRPVGRNFAQPSLHFGGAALGDGVGLATARLSGACTLIVEEQERPLRRWDYFHCPAGTRHVIVGAGDGPCVVLMVGARVEHESFTR